MTRSFGSAVWARIGRRGRSPSAPEWPPPASPDGTLFDLGLLRTRPRALNEAAIRNLCRTVRLSDDAVLCRALGRYKMYVDPSDEGLSPHLMLDGMWEIWVTEAMLGFVRPGMTVVDVGANLGYYTMLLADLVGPDGRVHAAEPNPRMMGFLRRSVQINGYAGRVTPHPEPLSAHVGATVVLHVPPGLPQNGHLRHDGAGVPGALELTTTTVDALVGDGPVDFIKIDAEGAEQAIWQGMAGVLARRQPLVVFLEFTPDRYPDAAGFLAHVLSTGFALGLITHRGDVRPVGVDGVLSGPAHVDRMLALVR